MSLDVEICVIKELPDVVCYFYADRDLVDAVIVSGDTVFVTIPYGKERIEVIGKEMITGLQVFKERILVSQLAAKTQLVPMDCPVLILHAREVSGVSPIKNPRLSPKFKYDHVIQLEKFQRSELMFLKELLKKAEQKELALKSSLLDMKAEYRGKVNVSDHEDPYEGLAGISGRKEDLTQEIYQQNLEINKLKADKQILRFELESCRNELKLQQIKNQITSVNRNFNKKRELGLLLEEKSRELCRKQTISNEMENELRILQDSYKNLDQSITALNKLVNPLISQLD